MFGCDQRSCSSFCVAISLFVSLLVGTGIAALITALSTKPQSSISLTTITSTTATTITTTTATTATTIATTTATTITTTTATTATTIATTTATTITTTTATTATTVATTTATTITTPTATTATTIATTTATTTTTTTTTTSTTTTATTTLPIVSVGVNDTLVGLWDTTAGSNSTISTPGVGVGNYISNQGPRNAFDGTCTTKYLSFGECINNGNSTPTCGTNTGFQVTLIKGAVLVQSLCFCTGNDQPTRDPITMTLEGSNQNGSALFLGSSWTLIYNGSCGLDVDPGRNKYGQNVSVTRRRRLTSERTFTTATHGRNLRNGNKQIIHIKCHLQDQHLSKNIPQSKHRIKNGQQQTINSSTIRNKTPANDKENKSINTSPLQVMDNQLYPETAMYIIHKTKKRKRRRYFTYKYCPCLCSSLCIMVSMLVALLVAIVIATIVVALLVKTRTTASSTTATTTVTILSIGVNDTLEGLWNTTAGGNSTISTPGYGTGNYVPYQGPSNIFDNNCANKYVSFGSCAANYSLSSLTCTLNTGFYVTLARGATVIKSLCFCTGNDAPARDPITMTLEGSNQNGSTLFLGSSWTLIYNGSCGLDVDPGRNNYGQTVTFSYNMIPYSSYRILITSKRGSDYAVQYGELRLFAS